MKKIGLLMTLLGVCGFAGVSGAKPSPNTNTNAALVNIQITAAVQKMVLTTNSGTVTTTYTTKSTKIGNAEILDMISTEFSMQFPAGAQLALGLGDNSGFVVLNPNGDMILHAGTNASDSAYSFSLSNNVTQAGSPQVFVGKEVNNQNTTNHTFVTTISQPDYGVFYQDSHGNNFHFTGMILEKANAVIGDDTTYKTLNVTLNGTGGGSFFNPASGHIDTGVFTSAKFTATGKDIVQ